MANAQNGTQSFQSAQQQPPINMPSMRPITAQDILMARQKLGPNSQNFTDDQIREILRNRQRQILMQATQNRAQMAGNMPPAPNQSMPQAPVSAQQPGPPAKPPTPHQSQVLEPAKAQTAAVAKVAKAPPAKQPSKKRPSADETADPRATATPQQTQPAALPSGPARPGAQFTQEQIAQMSPQQRLQIEAQIRRQQNVQFRGSVLNRAMAEEAWNKNLPPKVMEVYTEITKNAPASKPIPVSPEQKAIMTQQLRDSLDVLGRLDVLVLHGFPKLQGQEKNVRNLLAMRIQLMRQFKPSAEWIVNEQFTITPDYLTGSILFIRKLFQVMMLRMNQQRSNANQQQQQEAAPSGPPSTQPGTSALNATNLQQLQRQQEEEALQRAHRASSQSASVTAAPFGAPSPRAFHMPMAPVVLLPKSLSFLHPRRGSNPMPVPVPLPCKPALPPLPLRSTSRTWQKPNLKPRSYLEEGRGHALSPSAHVTSKATRPKAGWRCI